MYSSIAGERRAVQPREQAERVCLFKKGVGQNLGSVRPKTRALPLARLQKSSARANNLLLVVDRRRLELVA